VNSQGLRAAIRRGDITLANSHCRQISEGWKFESCGCEWCEAVRVIYDEERKNE
jgi:hypothetical protein